MTEIPDRDRPSHEGHRQRLKKRFLMEGFDNFEPHNILEMALFYTSARQDTNGLAHSLIDRFGSLAGVCDAPVEMLMTVPGIGQETAVFLKMLPEFARMYMQSRTNDKIAVTDAEAAVEFFAPRFIGRTKEVFMAAFIDGRGEVINAEIFAEGDAKSVIMDIPSVILKAVTFRASAVVIAHNHPHGFALPSQQDIVMTDKLADALRSVDIKLCDHIIFSREDHCRMSVCRSSARPYYVF